jgi:hypothetical protein
MAGINLSQLNIPKSEEPIRRKHVIRLDELSDAYSNPDKKKESFSNEPVAKGELKKPESKIEKVDRQLRKIEDKTDSLLKKAKERGERENSENPTSSIPQPIIKTTSTLHHSEPRASHFAFMSLPPRKIPRQILNHIKSNAFSSSGQWFSRIDSYELMSSTGKTAHYLSVAIGRLALEKWFEIIESSSGGYRILKIDPEIYGIS